MKKIISTVIVVSLLSLWMVNCGGSTSSKTPNEDSGSASADIPPQSWQEHWFEHDRVVNRKYYNANTAIYFDEDVDTAISWPNRYFDEVWQHVKDTYGHFGENGHSRLFAIFHNGRYSGGHPSTYLDASHDYRNVIDVGPGPWADSTGNNLDLPTHEVAHIVENASRGISGSPAFSIWRDSKWAEIFNYDVYVSLDMEQEAKRWHTMMMNNTDDFPRADTHWFRDWFYPIWKNHGKSQVLANYFELLASHFPHEDGSYTRDLNWGEFIHFWSGAAETNLKPLAQDAFGWPEKWETQYQNARQEFDEISY